MRRLWSVIVAAAWLAWATHSTAKPAAAQAQPVVIDRVAAVINQEVITLSEVQEAVLQQASAGRATTPGDPAFAAGVLTPQALHEQLRLLIQTRLQLQAAEQRGIAVSDPELGQALDEIKSRNRFASDAALAAALAAEGLTLEQYRQQLRKEILVAKLINREVRAQVVVSPDEVRRYYDEHAEEFFQPQRVRLRQILFAAPAGNPQARAAKQTRALEVLEQLRSGADFAQLARRYSDGPEAADGGELGWFAQGSLTPELDRAAFSLGDGEISEPVESPAGWHLVTVEQREGRQRRPFEQVKEPLHGRLLEERLRERYEEWFLELRRSAYVDIRL
jgi:peptidyl-prolyl cis-trans isomerase SurA